MQSFLSGREKYGSSTAESSSTSQEFRSMNHLSDSSSTEGHYEQSRDKNEGLEEKADILPEQTATVPSPNESRVEMSTDDGAYQVEVVSIEGIVDRVVINCPEGKKLVLRCEYDD